MEFKHKTRIWLIPLVLGWLCDILFFKQRPGITFPIFSALTLAAGLLLVTGEAKKPRASSLALIIPIMFFAVMFAVRAEPFTKAINFLFTMGGLALLTGTLLGGQWFRYTAIDMLLNPILVAIGAVVEPLLHFIRQKNGSTETVDGANAPKKNSLVLPLLRGLLLAVPIIALLAALLASADPLFSDTLERFLEIFNIDNLAEYIMRGIFIAGLGYLLMGIFLYAALHSHNEKLTSKEKPLVPAFLGWIEASVILSLVNLLFAIFVGIQVRYFFGGQANIHVDGFTYAEYARRGFGELVVVAIVSLLVLQILSAIVKRLERRPAVLFSSLGAVLVLLVLVILLSAFQRLWLYESAYGFTQTRAYTHIFIIWLGLLLITTFVLEITRNTRAFAIATLLAALGFGVSINIVNIDAYVVRQNLTRAQIGSEFDPFYFLNLSTDATPYLAAAFQDSRLPASVRDRVGAVLACKNQPDNPAHVYQPDWRSWHLSEYRAALAFNQIKAQLADYTRIKPADAYYETIITPLGINFQCNPYPIMD